MGALNRVDPKIHKQHRDAGFFEDIGHRAVLGRAMPGDAEHRQVRLQREDFLSADALLRGLANQRNVFDLWKLRHVSGVGIGVKFAQVVLPAHLTVVWRLTLYCAAT